MYLVILGWLLFLNFHDHLVWLVVAASAAASAALTSASDTPLFSSSSSATRSSLAQQRQQQLATDLATATHDELEGDDVEVGF